jgi:hypothetical protein
VSGTTWLLIVCGVALVIAVAFTLWLKPWINRGEGGEPVLDRRSAPSHPTYYCSAIGNEGVMKGTSRMSFYTQKRQSIVTTSRTGLLVHSSIDGRTTRCNLAGLRGAGRSCLVVRDILRR